MLSILYRLGWRSTQVPRKPAYRRIARNIEDEIISGALRRGERSPSISQLRRRYGVSAQPVKNALIVLQEQGLTRGQQGRGVFVAAGPPAGRVGDHRPGGCV